MSMPSINLNCDKCDYHGCTTVVWGLYSYIIEETEVPLNRTLGWCNACKSLKPIEYFNEEDPFRIIIECRDELKKLQSLWILNTLIPYRRREIVECQNKIIENSLLLHIILDRKGTEKCLSCGSENIMLFDGDYFLDYDISGTYVGKKKTGFIHPGCGGELIATPSEWRLNMKFTPKYYDRNGILISSED